MASSEMLIFDSSLDKKSAMLNIVYEINARYNLYKWAPKLIKKVVFGWLKPAVAAYATRRNAKKRRRKKKATKKKINSYFFSEKKSRWAAFFPFSSSSLFSFLSLLLFFFFSLATAFYFLRCCMHEDDLTWVASIHHSQKYYSRVASFKFADWQSWWTLAKEGRSKWILMEHYIHSSPLWSNLQLLWVSRKKKRIWKLFSQMQQWINCSNSWFSLVTISRRVLNRQWAWEIILTVEWGRSRRQTLTGRESNLSTYSAGSSAIMPREQSVNIQRWI